MRDVAIIGTNAAPVQKQVPSLRELALQSSVVALANARLSQVDGVVVGSMASEEFTGRNHLGPLLADQLGHAGHPRAVRPGPERHQQIRVNLKLHGDEPAKLCAVVEQSRRRSAVSDLVTNAVPVSIDVDPA